MLEDFILMQCRNCKIMWLIMSDKDNIVTCGGHCFTTNHLLTIIKILSTT